MVICFIFINGDIYIFQIRRANRTNNQTATTQAVRSGAHKNPPATTFRWMLDVRFHNPKLFPNPLFHLTLRSSTNLFFITIFLGFYSSISITTKHCYKTTTSIEGIQPKEKAKQVQSRYLAQPKKMDKGKTNVA